MQASTINGLKQELASYKEKFYNQEKSLKDQLEKTKRQDEALEQANDKIKALNIIHSDKTRNLLSSIEILNKQNQELKNAQKSHVMAKKMKKLNDDIAEQDGIIKALRKLVNDNEKADRTILKVLKKEPKILKPPSREELRIEIQNLKKQLYPFLNQARIETQSSQSNQSSQRKSYGETSSERNTDKETLDHSQEDNDRDLYDQIRSLEQENEDLKLNFKAILNYNEKQKFELIEAQKQKEEYLKLQIQKENLDKELINMRQQIEVIKNQQNIKAIGNFDQLVRLEELELLNKTYGEKIQSLERNLQLEKNQLKLKMNELSLKRKEMIEENSNLKMRIQEKKDIIQKQQDQIDHQNDNIKELKDSIESMQGAQRELIAQNNEKIAVHEKDKQIMNQNIQKLNETIAQQRIRMKTLEESLENAQKQLYLTQENTVPTSQGGQQATVENADQTEQVVMNDKQLLIENQQLKEKLHHITQNEIHLQCQLEELQTIRQANKAMKQDKKMRDTAATKKRDIDEEDISESSLSSSKSSKSSKGQKEKLSSSKVSKKSSPKKDVKKIEESKQEQIDDSISNVSYEILDTNSNLNLTESDELNKNFQQNSDLFNKMMSQQQEENLQQINKKKEQVNSDISEDQNQLSQSNVYTDSNL